LISSKVYTMNRLQPLRRSLKRAISSINEINT
jgi:hypothetical protein